MPSFGSAYRSVDLFGQGVSFTFGGESQYKTSIGATISLFCISLMIAFVSVRTSKLISREDPLLTATSISKDDSIIDLGGQGFMFAIQKPDPRIGVMQAIWTKKSFEKLDMSIDLPFELVDCRELLQGGKYEN